MSTWFFLTILIIYFLCLFTISWFTSRKANQNAYYLGNKSSPWYAVAFGLIGDSLSGVTFVSVPGNVATQEFGYMQIVIGYLLGYFVIATVLLPLYYRLNLTSIYTYLGQRFGKNAQKTGSFYFIVSRLVGAAFRLYVSATVLQLFIFQPWGVPFEVTVSIVIILILLYTYRGGIKTLVWTDTLQSSFLLMGVILSIIAIAGALNLDFNGIIDTVRNSEHNQIFFWDVKAPNYFWKQFISGALIAIVMTGLDQNMMQKNLSMRTLPEAQKNILWFSVVLIFINLLFVSLGALLYEYIGVMGIDSPARTDHLFPILALDYLGIFAAVVFILGIAAATFSSADSVLTTLTTSFCIDILGWDVTQTESTKQKQNRHIIHVLFAVILLIVIIVFNAINNDAVINQVFAVAGYTYGPLLGLFAFGIITKRNIMDKVVLLVCLLPPFICYYLNMHSKALFNGYQIGYELLLINGILTFIGLLLISSSNSNKLVQS
ncbi:MAG TPA: sodium:solute symporter [Chitinophagales bacterium]|nr:sodium:solute symporter [Chitinophagales bacterium]HRG86493.1 sodium:solute symporter [Chitinophagales bacterium]HRH54279.1 sodium:solute symporter [Chitinophagales bacterium]